MIQQFQPLDLTVNGAAKFTEWCCRCISAQLHDDRDTEAVEVLSWTIHKVRTL